MEELICAICHNRVSNVCMASGQATFTIEGKLIHLSHTNQMTLHEISETIKDGLDKEAGWIVGIPVVPEN